jgi:hypothetical protein
VKRENGEHIPCRTIQSEAPMGKARKKVIAVVVREREERTRGLSSLVVDEQDAEARKGTVNTYHTGRC